MAMNDKVKAPVAAQQIGISYFLLMSFIRSGRMPSPERDTSGHYWFSREDIERARAAMGVDRRRKEHRHAAV